MPDNAIDEGFSLQKYRGRYVALFFYPLDFTFVCPASWEKGKEAMEPTAVGVKKYLKDFGLKL